MQPTITNSKTKLGAVISFITTVIILFLPEFGIHLQETLLQKILFSIDGFGMLLSVFGLRNAISTNLNYAVTGQLPAKKGKEYSDPYEPSPLDQ